MTNLILDRLDHLCYRTAYSSANRKSNRAVHMAKSETEKVALQKMEPRSAEAYRLAKQFSHDSQDAMGEKRVKNDEDLLPLDEDATKEAWQEHYEVLLNVHIP